MSDGMPDWLSELAPADSSGDESSQDAFSQPAAQPPSSDTPEQDLLSSDDDLMADLLQPSYEEDEETAAKKSPSRMPRLDNDFLGLQPWQRFVLSVLTFFNVLIIGLMFLVMLGRISFF